MNTEKPAPAVDMNVLLPREGGADYFPLLVYPNQGLRRVGKAVTDFGDVFQTIVDKMVATMYRAQGVGLAAVQVGIDARVFIIDCPDPGNNGLRVFVNPVITDMGPMVKGLEGCLSFPGVSEQIERASWVVGQAQDRFGVPFTFVSAAAGKADSFAGALVLSEVETVAVQHELEHLDGVLMIDKVSRIKQRHMKKTVQKVLKGL